MRTGVTIEDVTRAADTLLGKGERPTVEGVRMVLGTGSPGNVNTLLKQYFKALPERLTLPAPIALAAAELYKKVRDSAQEEIDRIDAEQQAAIKLERERIISEKAVFEAERTQLRADVSTLNMQLIGLKELNSALEQRLSDAQLEVASQTRRTTAAEAHATAAIEERERLSRKHQDEVTQLHERADGNERHLLLQIDDFKIQVKRLGAEKDREHVVAIKRIASLETQVIEHASEIAEQREALISLNAQVATEQQGRRTAEIEFNSHTEALSREAEGIKSQRDLAMAERDAERVLTEQLRRERDVALRDAAIQQGQREALLNQLEQIRSKPHDSRAKQ